MPFLRSEPSNELPELPPSRDVETEEILRQTVRSARALANLKGTAAKMPNQGILVNGIVLQEAFIFGD